MTAFRQREFELFILILFKSELTISLTKQFPPFPKLANMLVPSIDLISNLTVISPPKASLSQRESTK